MEIIKAYQHQLLNLNSDISPAAHAALLRYKSAHRAPYFEPTHQGLRIGHYVGVLQVGPFQLEILPKLDYGDANHWRDCLLTMLAATRPFAVDILGQAHLSLASGTLLDWYCQLFLHHVEQLIAVGLLKKYRPIVSNSHALRGQLLLAQQLQHNHCHQEYFYTRHHQYDLQHTLHAALRDGLRVLQRLQLPPRYAWRLTSALQILPDTPAQHWPDEAWQKLLQAPRAAHYAPALALARLLLQRFQPDFYAGQASALSIMFDMDSLWEQFILQTLRHAAPLCGWQVAAQATRDFYHSPLGDTRLRADIKLTYRDQIFVFDTKWKSTDRPSAEDLRQAYAYLHLYEATKVALVYPGDRPDAYGFFADSPHQSCSILFIPPHPNLDLWRRHILQKINNFISPHTN